MYSSAPLCISFCLSLPLISCAKYFNLYISRPTWAFRLFKLRGAKKLN
jgi:hypothetical protein